MANESTKTVLVSLGAGLGIALTKVGAAAVTVSAACFSQVATSRSTAALFAQPSLLVPRSPVKRLGCPGSESVALLVVRVRVGGAGLVRAGARPYFGPRSGLVPGRRHDG